MTLLIRGLSNWIVALIAGLVSLSSSGMADEPSKPLSGNVESCGTLQGFASVEAYGLKTTTGGGNLPPIVVRSAQELRVAAERSDLKNKAQRDSTPRVILVAQDLDLGELANAKPGAELKSVGRILVRSHTTIHAAGTGATLRRGTLDIHGAQNVILRNLRFRDLWELDPTGEYDRFGWDSVRITNSGPATSHHVWIDHCDFGKVYDGMLDITHGSDLVTISWCRF
ncbi:MAG TPA: hypothetical protein VF593_10140, partial [Chthoniobacteraceae bacterium]